MREWTALIMGVLLWARTAGRLAASVEGDREAEDVKEVERRIVVAVGRGVLLVEEDHKGEEVEERELHITVEVGVAGRAGAEMGEVAGGDAARGVEVAAKAQGVSSDGCTP